MKCPKCSSPDDKVLDSRAVHDGKGIRRRRECLACGYRFTTFEEILREELRVVKRDGTHEPFSRQKMYNGIMAACQKRPVSADDVNGMIDGIIEEIGAQDRSDVSSAMLGEMVMDRLEKTDSVAYVRFASVYKRFADVGQFKSAVDEIKGEQG